MDRLGHMWNVLDKLTYVNFKKTFTHEITKFSNIESPLIGQIAIILIDYNETRMHIKSVNNRYMRGDSEESV